MPTHKTTSQDKQHLSPSSATCTNDVDTDDSPESLHAETDADSNASTESLQADTDEDSNDSKASHHHTLCSLRKIPRQPIVSSAPSATKQHRTKEQDEAVHRHLEDSSVSIASIDPILHSTRLYSPCMLTNANNEVKIRRCRWNLARVNYCELERPDDEGTQCDTIVLSPPIPYPHGSDQDTIGWEGITIFFTSIVAAYFRINKLGRRFTTKNDLPLLSPPSSKYINKLGSNFALQIHAPAV